MARGKNAYSTEFNQTNVPAGTATTVICTVPSATQAAYAVLHTITINTKGATANTLTVYDNTSAAGTKIATIDTTSQVQTLVYDCICTTGITCVSATGTGADYTVTWSM